MATTADNLLDPGPAGVYPNWSRDASGNPIQPTDGGGKPIYHARGMTGELYAIHPAGAFPLDHGRAPVLIPKWVP